MLQLKYLYIYVSLFRSHDGGINGISFWIDGSLMVAAGYIKPSL